MNKGLTEMIFIIDRSGSMSGLEEDTIGGFNAMIAKQKKIEAAGLVTTILFDNKYEVLHNREPLNEVLDINTKDYYVRGTTALLDAIGITVSNTAKIQNTLKPEYKASNIIIVIITDGMENASSEYSYNSIKTMIESKKKNNNWEFVFLGANIDALGIASKFGIHESRAANYHADEEGTKLNYETISSAISYMRANKKLDDNWKGPIDDDFKSREKWKK